MARLLAKHDPRRLAIPVAHLNPGSEFREGDSLAHSPAVTVERLEPCATDRANVHIRTDRKGDWCIPLAETVYV